MIDTSEVRNKDNNFETIFFLLVDILWKSKLSIIFFIILFFIFGILVLHNTKFKKEVSATLFSVEIGISTDINSNLGGIASLIGLDENAGNKKNFNVYIATLKSRYMSKQLNKDISIMKNIFPNLYDFQKNEWKKPSLSRTQKIKNKIKKLLGFPVYKPSLPNDETVFNLLQKMEVKNNKEAGTKIAFYTSEVEATKFLLKKVLFLADKELKRRSIERSNQFIDFVTNKLKEVTQKDQRQALIQLLFEQQNNIMMSSTDVNFAADNPGGIYVSDFYVKPNPKNILILSVVLGFLFGILFSLIRNFVKI